MKHARKKKREERKREEKGRKKKFSSAQLQNFSLSYPSPFIRGNKFRPCFLVVVLFLCQSMMFAIFHVYTVPRTETSKFYFFFFFFFKKIYSRSRGIYLGNIDRLFNYSRKQSRFSRSRWEIEIRETIDNRVETSTWIRFEGRRFKVHPPVEGKLTPLFW